MGWFFGFKLHLICNEMGELLNFMITPGDVDDRKSLEYKALFIYAFDFSEQNLYDSICKCFYISNLCVKR